MSARIAVAVALFFGSLAAASCSFLGDLSNAQQNAEQTVKREAGNALAGPGTCCVNDQFFACPDGASSLQCVGNPVQMGTCADACPMGDDACHLDCVAKHGPNPSGCTRDVGRDGECHKS